MTDPDQLTGPEAHPGAAPGPRRFLAPAAVIAVFLALETLAYTFADTLSWPTGVVLALIAVPYWLLTAVIWTNRDPGTPQDTH